MDIADTILSRYPRFAHYVRAKLWEASFSKRTIAASIPYANARSIVPVPLAPGEGNPDSFKIEAEISGGQFMPFFSSIRMIDSFGRISIVADCTCPVGLFCKHSCAFLRVMSAQLARGSTSDSGMENPLGQLDYTTNAWLAELQKAARGPAVRKASTPYNKFLAYCIELSPYDSSSLPHMVLRVATRSKHAIIIESSTATADITRPPKYMTEEDIKLVTILRRIERKQGGYVARITGEGWGPLLEGAMAEDRLFHLTRPHGYSGFQGTPVVPGPPEPVDATWQSNAEGDTRPVLRWSRKNLIFLPTEPALYFEPYENQIGPVESPHSTTLLTAWEKGPSIPRSKIQILATRLQTVSAKPLPLPAELEVEERPASPPVPHLQICRRAVGIGLNSHEVLMGIPTFRYADSPALPPLAWKAKPVFTHVTGNLLVSWPRDAKQEARHLQTLLTHGMVPLADSVSAEDLDKTTRLAVTLPEETQPAEGVWFEFLNSPRAESIRNAGWVIEVEPRAGLTAHDAGDFFTELESDPDHGIDWFRFDLMFEVNGRKVSMIPLIADIIAAGFPPSNSPDLPETLIVACQNPEDGFVRFPARRLMEMVEQVCHLFHQGEVSDGPLKIDRLAAAGVADAMNIDSSETLRALANLGRALKNITALPEVPLPHGVRAGLRSYQQDGYRWLQFLAAHGLNGILADDMGLGKTLQTLTHLAAEHAKSPGRPSLVIAPTSVVPNWTAEAARFTPDLKIVVLHGKERAASYEDVADADVVLTSYPLVTRDAEVFTGQEWHLIVLDEAQYIKNPKAVTTLTLCQLKSAHRVCLSGTPMENHLGELWSLMRFLMPGFLGDEKSFNSRIRRPIERDHSADAQLSLNRRVSPLILRRTKDEVATDLPDKTELIHHVELTPRQTDLYESVRASMDKRVREAIAAKGLAKSHIIVLDALLKLRQICCHPQLLKLPAAAKAGGSAKLDYLVTELLPTLLEEGRRILLFSQFTSMLALIEEHLQQENIPYLILTGKTQDRASLVSQFQEGKVPIFLISLKAGGTGLNLTAADTVIHYDPWWNPAAENQATDRAHRIGQTKPVFVHKLVCRGTIEDRILELQKHKAALVEALLSDETSRLRIDSETLSHLLSPLD